MAKKGDKGEKGDARLTKKQIDENLKKFTQGLVDPVFKNLPSLAADATRPSGKDVDGLSSTLVNVVPEPGESSSGGIQSEQSREELIELISKVAATIGFTPNPSHYEDLFVISKRLELTIENVWTYLRGAMRSLQDSIIDDLKKTVEDMKANNAKTNANMVSFSDTNRQLTEKVNLVSTKIDTITPALTAVVKEEIRSSKALISGLKASMSTPSASVAVPPNRKDAYPGTNELKAIFLAGKFKEKYFEKMITRYIGKVTWDDYDKVITGKMLPDEIKALVEIWHKTKV